MLRSTLALVMTVVPGAALADVAVKVQLRTPAVRVSVTSGPVYAQAREVQPPAPSPDHVWIDGHWGHSRGHRGWVPGRWVLPPGPDYVWVPARWVDHGGTAVFHEGHWRQLPATVVYTPERVHGPVVVHAAPPAPRVEARPAPPMVGAVWIPGHWRWHDRRHVWVNGRWSEPRRGYVWQADGWRRDGNRRWVYQAGHWRRDDNKRNGWDRDRRRDRDDDDRRGRGHRHGHRKHRH